MNWDDVIGHEKTKIFLKRLTVGQHRPHAFLFSGQAGIGKILLAQIFAKTLLCACDDNPCGQCKQCRSFEQDNHPDYFFLQPDLKADGQTRKDTISIAQVRDLLKEAAFLPKEGANRVALIDEAHLMTPEAENSLLKLLEEPPAGWIFVLVASKPEVILPTILSRVTTIKLERLKEEEILLYFKQTGIISSHNEIAASLADGSIGRALYFATAEAKQVRLETIDFLLACQLGDHLQAAAFVRKIAKDKAIIACEFMAAFLRDAWRVAVSDNENVWNKDLTDKIKQISDRCNIRVLKKDLEYVEITLDAIKRAANPQLAMEGLYISIGREM